MVRIHIFEFSSLSLLLSFFVLTVNAVIKHEQINQREPSRQSNKYHIWFSINSSLWIAVKDWENALRIYAWLIAIDNQMRG